MPFWLHQYVKEHPRDERLQGPDGPEVCRRCGERREGTIGNLPPGTVSGGPGQETAYLRRRLGPDGRTGDPPTVRSMEPSASKLVWSKVSGEARGVKN